MAIRITEDGVVIYENEPEVDRELFPNIKDGCGCQEQIDEITGNLSELQELVDTKADVIYETASGSIASFTDGADDMPIKSCVVTIEPIQEGEGDPSPENVRAISGRTGLTVFHSGADTSDPTTISVDWETEVGIVYGATLDVASGKLVVDRAGVDLGTLTWTYNPNWGGGGAFYCNTAPSGIKTDNPPNLVPNALCSCYTAYSRSFLYNNSEITGFCIPNTTAQISIRDSSYNDSTSFKTAMSGVLLCYELATPTEIQLTGQEVRTLLGENNIWSDAGDMAVEYPADTKMYIEKLTTPTEDDMIADHEISANSFFMVGNTLYRAITAIASGATITPGTNAVKLSLSDALNELA